MRYGVLDPSQYVPFLELDSTEFDSTRIALLEVSSILAIEEKFVNLVENYRELVVDALRLSVSHTNLPSTVYDEYINDIHLFNRRILNVLASARAYLDHVPHDLSSLRDHAHLKDRLKGLTHRSYDLSFSYRLLEGLRNFVQHRSLPLAAITHHDSWQNAGVKGETHRLHRLELLLDKTRMCDDSEVKASLRNEIKATQTPLDLLLHIREYVAQLAEIHQTLRAELTEIAEPHERRITERVEQFAKNGGEVPSATYLVQQDDAENILQQFHVSDNYGRRRRTLVRLYSRLDSLTRQFVTNAPDPTSMLKDD